MTQFYPCSISYLFYPCSISYVFYPCSMFYLFYPCSIFYVFYEQYLDIVVNAVLNITYCLAAIFVITFLLLGFDLHSAVIVVVTILMVLVNIMGVMHLWNIELNALSLVNLIMVGT